MNDFVASDIIPVTPADSTDQHLFDGFYVTGLGAVSFITARGTTRTVSFPDNSFVPVRIRQIRATGTTATGIHGLVV